MEVAYLSSYSAHKVYIHAHMVVAILNFDLAAQFLKGTYLTSRCSHTPKIKVDTHLILFTIIMHTTYNNIRMEGISISPSLLFYKNSSKSEALVAGIIV